MPRALLLLLVMVVAAACDRAAPASNSGVDGSGSPADLRMAIAVDLAMTPADLATEPEPDLSTPADLARFPDLAGAGCKVDKDCRLYSNTCAAVKPNPCVCIPLPANAPDPPCPGLMVLCDTDPCEGKQPACNAMTGQCFAR